MAVIRVEGLRKTYRAGFLGRRVPALRGVSFAVPEGEIYGFLGANGAGKTTCLKILTGLLYPDGGEAAIFERPLGAKGVRRRIGYLPENPYFYEYLTARESLRFYGKLQGVPRREADARGSAALDRLDLAHAAGQRIREYSKGMRQRFGIAQALISNPDLLLLDEPLEGIDPRGRRMLKDLVLDLKAEGKTVLFSSHILADVEEIADRVCILHRGRVLRQGPLDEILRSRSTATDVVLADVGVALAERLESAAETLSSRDGTVRLRVRPDDGDPSDVIRTAILAGARVVEVTPHRETLEELFVREATTSDAADAQPLLAAGGAA